MKRAEEFREDFGMADEAFCRCVSKTLRELEQKGAKPMRKIKWSAAIALAIVLLASTVGVAAVMTQWGIMDLVNVDGLNIEPEETAGVVQTEVKQICGENDYASLTIREAVYDGVYAYIVMDLVPKEENVLMVPAWMDPETDTITCLDTGIRSNATIAEWAAENGFERILQFNGLGGIGFRVNENGSVTLMEVRRHEIRATPEELLQATYQGLAKVSLSWYKEPISPYKDIEVPFVLPNSGGVVKRYSSENTSDFHGLLDAKVKLEIIRTDFTNYVVIKNNWGNFEYYTNKGGESLYTHYSFEMIDNEGNVFPAGAVRYSMNGFKEMISTVKIDEVPEKIQIRLRKEVTGEEQIGDAVFATKLYSEEKFVETFTMGEVTEYRFDSTTIAEEYMLKEYFTHQYAVLAEPVAFEEAGVVLEKLKLTTYAWQTTYEANLSVQPVKSTKKGLVYKQVRLDILDDKGNVISDFRGAGSVYTNQGTLPVSTLPDTLQVKINVFDKNGKNEYGPVTIQLVKE